MIVPSFAALIPAPATGFADFGDQHGRPLRRAGAGAVDRSCRGRRGSGRASCPVDPTTIVPSAALFAVLTVAFLVEPRAPSTHRQRASSAAPRTARTALLPPLSAPFLAESLVHPGTTRPAAAFGFPAISRAASELLVRERLAGGDQLGRGVDLPPRVDQQEPARAAAVSRGSRRRPCASARPIRASVSRRESTSPTAS